MILFVPLFFGKLQIAIAMLSVVVLAIAFVKPEKSNIVSGNYICNSLDPGSFLWYYYLCFLTSFSKLKLWK